MLSVISQSLQSLSAELRQAATDTHCDHFYFRLESIVHVLSRFVVYGQLQHEDEIFSHLNDALHELHIFSLPVQTCERFFFLNEEQLKYLLDKHFTVKEIAAMYSVSQRTIRNRMTQYQLSVRQTYSDISDEDLKKHLMDFIASSPNSGQKMVMGHLKARGIRYVSNYIENVNSSEISIDSCLKLYTMTKHVTI